MNSDEKPAGDINCLFARDKYQGGAGNLPHIHAIVRVNYDANDPHAVDAFQDHIQGFVSDIIRVEEIDDYVAEGLLRDRDEWYEIQKLAGSILTHHSERNMKRVGTADGDVVMRDNNQFYKNSHPTKYQPRPYRECHQGFRAMWPCHLSSRRRPKEVGGLPPSPRVQTPVSAHEKGGFKHVSCDSMSLHGNAFDDECTGSYGIQSDTVCDKVHHRHGQEHWNNV
jgi:hypothetical protein